MGSSTVPILGSSEQFELATPRPDALIESLRVVGYSLSTALADLIDNSLTASAKKIRIDFSAPARPRRPRIPSLSRGRASRSRESRWWAASTAFILPGPLRQNSMATSSLKLPGRGSISTRAALRGFSTTRSRKAASSESISRAPPSPHNTRLTQTR